MFLEEQGKEGRKVSSAQETRVFSQKKSIELEIYDFVMKIHSTKLAVGIPLRSKHGSGHTCQQNRFKEETPGFVGVFPHCSQTAGQWQAVQFQDVSSATKRLALSADIYKKGSALRYVL